MMSPPTPLSTYCSYAGRLPFEQGRRREDYRRHGPARCTSTHTAHRLCRHDDVSASNLAVPLAIPGAYKPPAPAAS